MIHPGCVSSLKNNLVRIGFICSTSWLLINLLFLNNYVRRQEPSNRCIHTFSSGFNLLMSLRSMVIYKACLILAVQRKKAQKLQNCGSSTKFVKKLIKRFPVKITPNGENPTFHLVYLLPVFIATTFCKST